MLQILTGKFFEGKGKLEQQPTEAILHSNWMCYGTIKTPVGELRRSMYGEGVVSNYIFHYVNKYERASDKDPMVLAHSDEVVDQFRTLCCLWHRSVFHPNRAFVESLISTRTRYVDRYLAARNDASGEDREAFGKFVEDVTSLPREKYLKVIACVRAFTDSIEALTTNFDVAYSMLVYMLEALSKASDEKFTPTWQDYEEGQRKKIDALCEKIDEKVATDIRAILTNTQHLKLSKRFVDFVIGNVQDSFYTNEAEGRQWAIRKSELPRLLKNVYTTRSGYVHELQEALEDIRFHCTVQAADTIRSRNDVHLSYSGLVRLARHVLITFVRDTPKPAQESVAWRNQIPGLVSVEMAPEYWIWRTEGFSQEHARHRFSGFAAYFMDLLTKPTAMMTPLRPVVDIIDKELPAAKKENKPALIGMFWLYNMHIVQDKAVPDWEEKLNTAMNAEEKCQIEYLAVIALVQGKLSFDGAASEQAYREYVQQRHKPKGVNLPPRLEIAVLCYVANIHLEEGKHEDYRRLLYEAIADLAGFPDVQSSLTSTRDALQAVDLAPLLGQPTRPKPQPEETSEPDRPSNAAEEATGNP